MRPTTPLPLLLLLLCTACTASAPVPRAPGDISGYFTVQARGDSWVGLGQEAYVAVFHVVHDQGAVLVWPYSQESDGMLPQGMTDLPPRTSDEERIARWRESFLFPGHPTGTRGSGQQSLTLVVASSRPLSLERYLMDHEALWRDLGGDFIDITRATATILDLVVEDRQGHNWAWACSGTPHWCRGG